MADLRIVDAPLIPKVDITGSEKIPTGGSGNYSISLDGIAEYAKESLDLADKTDVLNSENGVKALLKQHTDNLSNPHVVTKDQVGLGNVDNTADADKPMSNLTQSTITTLDQKKADKTSVYLKTETYNKNEVDSALANKPNSNTVYTKIETNNLLNGKVSSVNGKNGTAITLTRSDLGISSDEVMQQWLKEARFVEDESGLNQQQINNKLITTVESIADLIAINNPRNGQVVFVKSIEKNYSFKPSTSESENGVTVVGKWEMEIQDVYYASMFCAPSSIDNVNEPQTDVLNLAYRYATSKSRSLIIDNTYYVESKVMRADTAYPTLNGSDSLHYAIRVLSNSSLIFKKGVGKLKLVPNDQAWSRILCVYDVENYAIFDPELIGDKSQHLSTTGEQHLLLAFHPSKNGYVRNPIMRNSWGDGMYFGYASYTSKNLNVDVDYPTNLTIDNPRIYNSSRNAVSLCGAENLFVNNLYIDIVDRIAPISGIDIEPEEDHVYNGGKYMHVKNVKFNNTTIKNCNNYGVMAFIYGNRDIDVSFTGTTTITSEVPNYCSFPIWFNSHRGDISKDDYNVGGIISFEKIISNDDKAKWATVAPISFYSEIGLVGLSISNFDIKTKNELPIFNFDNSTNVIGDFNANLDVSSLIINTKSVKLQSNVIEGSLRNVNLPIPNPIKVEHIFRSMFFDQNVNIGGYAEYNQSGWYNTNDLINNAILLPHVNIDDSGSTQSRVYDLNEKSNGRTMSYSLKQGLTDEQRGGWLIYSLWLTI